MDINRFKKGLNFSNDMINVFSEYANNLDRYFVDEQNRKEHRELYQEYLRLRDNLISITKKNGFYRKKW